MPLNYNPSDIADGLFSLLHHKFTDGAGVAACHTHKVRTAGIASHVHSHATTIGLAMEHCATALVNDAHLSRAFEGTQVKRDRRASGVRIECEVSTAASSHIVRTRTRYSVLSDRPVKP